MLIDPEPLRRQRVHVRQSRRGHGQRRLYEPPRDQIRTGGLVRGAAGNHERIHEGNAGAGAWTWPATVPRLWSP